MTDLSELSPAALKAAMQGGTAAWGQMGSIRDVRYAEPIVPKSRKKCWCGCEGKRTHKGMANGMCLTTACQLGIQRWVKTGMVRAAPVNPRFSNVTIAARMLSQEDPAPHIGPPLATRIAKVVRIKPC